MQMLQLKSLETLFCTIENTRTEAFSHRLQALAQDENCSEENLFLIQELLHYYSPLTMKTQMDYTLVTGLAISKSQDYAQKQSLMRQLIAMTQSADCSFSALEVVARTIVNYCIEIERFPGNHIQEKRDMVECIDRMRKRGSTTLDMAEIFAQALFNQSVDEPTLPKKMKCARRLFAVYRELKNIAELSLQLAKAMDMPYAEMDPENPSLHEYLSVAKVSQHLAKTLANMSFIDSTPENQLFYKHTYQEVIRAPHCSEECLEIYARVISHWLQSTTREDTLREYLEDITFLKKLLPDNLVVMQSYLEVVFMLALNTDDIELKRSCVKWTMTAIAQKNWEPPIYLAASRTLFNHIIDETEINDKKKYLEEMKQCLKISGFHSAVLCEYARTLVNMIVDSNEVEEQQKYLATLCDYATQRNANPNVVLEYAKALLNLSLNPNYRTQFSVLIARLLTLLELTDYESIELEETSKIDFRCIHAEGIILRLGYEVNRDARRRLLGQIPDLKTFRESDYFSIFGDMLEDAVGDKKNDAELKKMLLKMYTNYQRLLRGE